MPFHREQG